MCLAIPGRIIEIADLEPLTRSGKVSFEGMIKTVNLSFVPDAKVGDYVIVHAGFAISILDEVAAMQTLQLLGDMPLDETEP